MYDISNKALHHKATAVKPISLFQHWTFMYVIKTFNEEKITIKKLNLLRKLIIKVVTKRITSGLPKLMSLPVRLYSILLNTY